MRAGAGASAALASRALAHAPIPFKEIFSSHSSSPSSSPFSSPIEISYGAEKSQFGELRLPRGAGPHPVAVVVHGGFWKSGYGLDLMNALSSAITGAGVATWNIEYRRVGEEGGGWPGTFRDVSRATNHLRAAAKTHPLDLTRVASIGHSAGGHLALWLAARPRIWKTDPLFEADPLRVSGAVSLAGVPDLARAFRDGVGGGAVGALMGGPPGEMADRYLSSSPAELLPLGVPQILVHGERDEIVPFDLSYDYAGRAKAGGDDARLVRVPGGHFDIIDPKMEAGKRAVAEVVALLRS
jgi:acetyl esterase/lipase